MKNGGIYWIVLCATIAGALGWFWWLDRQPRLVFRAQSWSNSITSPEAVFRVGEDTYLVDIKGNFAKFDGSHKGRIPLDENEVILGAARISPEIFVYRGAFDLYIANHGEVTSQGKFPWIQDEEGAVLFGHPHGSVIQYALKSDQAIPLQLQSVETGILVERARFVGHPKDGEFLIVAADRKELHLYNAEGLRQILATDEPIVEARMSGDTLYYVSRTRWEMVDVETGDVIQSLSTDEFDSGVSISQDCTWVVGFAIDEMRLWNTKSNEVIEIYLPEITQRYLGKKVSYSWISTNPLRIRCVTYNTVWPQYFEITGKYE